MLFRLFEIVRLAIRNLGANLIRSMLTLLGIVIGVASVIFMMSVTAGAGQRILEDMQQLGLRNIIINSIDAGAGADSPEAHLAEIRQYGLLKRDVEQIKASALELDFISQVHQVREDTWVYGSEASARVIGVDPRYLDVLGLELVTGRRISDLDNLNREFVCNVGSRLLREQGVVGDGLGTTIQVRDRLFRVVGVVDQPHYTERGERAFATGSEPHTIYLPASTVMQVFGTDYPTRGDGSSDTIRVEVDQLVVGVPREGAVIPTADAIREILEYNHGDRRDYEMIVPKELLLQEQRTQRVFAITMILVASVSLLVGGIGIINIMLATVTERTREIGIRRACGAKQSNIAYQFLIETTTLAFIGGIIGAGVGISAVRFIAPRLGWPSVITGTSVILALGISCAVGIIFGTVPAIKASKMDPIRALRFE